MKTWTREDGRFYSYHLSRDLFGPVVVIYHGGAKRPGRIRIIPVSTRAQLKAEIGKLVKRRRQHGYDRDSTSRTTARSNTSATGKAPAAGAGILPG